MSRTPGIRTCEGSPLVLFRLGPHKCVSSGEVRDRNLLETLSESGRLVRNAVRELAISSSVTGKSARREGARTRNEYREDRRVAEGRIGTGRMLHHKHAQVHKHQRDRSALACTLVVLAEYITNATPSHITPRKSLRRLLASTCCCAHSFNPKLFCLFFIAAFCVH